MLPEARAGKAPDYGVDAPAVVRNLCIAGGAGLLLWTLTATGVVPGAVVFARGRVRIVYAPAALTAGASMLAVGLWMLWSSLRGKVRARERLLGRHVWRGDERVLDLGCGRGLLLTGSARRLTTGMATGVDIWQTEDLSGNQPQAAIENARREGVAGRVTVATADMRTLPFPAGDFDLVVSRAAIHNIYDAAGRVRAVGEIVRVLKPGGEALIEDIRHAGEYAAEFARNGCRAERLDPAWLGWLWALITLGSFRPFTLRARKPKV